MVGEVPRAEANTSGTVHAFSAARLNEITSLIHGRYSIVIMIP